MKNIFEVEYKVKSRMRKSSYVMVRLLNEISNFELTDNARLGELPIQKTFSVPRAEANRESVKLIIFFPKNKQDLDKLEIGQVVELIP